MPLLEGTLAEEVMTRLPQLQGSSVADGRAKQGAIMETMDIKALKIALRVVGVTFIFGIYLFCQVWPSGWAWQHGHSNYLDMILAVYATLGVFLLIASRNPLANLSLIWFTVWSSVVHGGTMAVQSMPAAHRGHLIGDVPALFLVAIVLGGLLLWSEHGQAKPLGPSAPSETVRAEVE